MRGKNTVIQWHVERMTEEATTGHPFQGASNQRVKLDLSFFLFEIIAVKLIIQTVLQSHKLE